MKKDCPERRQWASEKASKVAAAAPGTKPPGSRTLCTVQGNRADLPRVFVDVQVNDELRRVDATVDTGSMCTLVSSTAVEMLGLNVDDSGHPDDLVALDGSTVQVLGTAALCIQRLDGPVHLPTTCITALVVPHLSVVGTDLLLGSDMVSSVGGVSLSYAGGELASVYFGSRNTPKPEDHHPCRHVETVVDGDDLTFRTDDGQIMWNAQARKWALSWTLKAGQPPTNPIGAGTGKYGRGNMSPEQEALFLSKITSWIENGWLVPHNPVKHGEPAAVLPLMAVAQEHKPTTPVRPVLDYRELNKLIKSFPGADAPACVEKLRLWRAAGPAEEHQLLDIRKAYLQVHLSPELLRYQTVIWKGQKFVMTRMGFGLSIAPKFLDIIVQWVTREFSDVDNYADDLCVPSADSSNVAAALAEYGLPTKDPEPFPSTRVLGLQLYTARDGQTHWKRRAQADLKCGDKMTRRDILLVWQVGQPLSCVWLAAACMWLLKAPSILERWLGRACG